MGYPDRSSIPATLLFRFGLVAFFSAAFGWLALSGAAKGTVAPVDFVLAVVAGGLVGVIGMHLTDAVLGRYLGDREITYTVATATLTAPVSNILSVDRIPAVLFAGAVGVLWAQFVLDLRDEEPEESATNSKDLTVDG